ncbi:MAG: sensor histidine kinase [Candidatus Thorarchaeota archaeon]
MGCLDTSVMIWDPLERLMWGIALTIGITCGIYFILISRKREIFRERAIMQGLASLPLGFALSLFFIYFQALQINGALSDFIFCGNYEDVITPSYEILGKLSYASFGLGGAFFVFGFERIVNRTKYFLTLTFIVVILIEIIVGNYEIARSVFNFLLLPLMLFVIPSILFLYTKWSHLEFKAVSSFLLFGFLLFILSLNLAKRAHKSLNVFPLYLSPLFFIIGCCITALPIIINPKVLSKALFYWILFTILTMLMFLPILIFDIIFGLNIIFLVEFYAIFGYIYGLIFFIIKDIRSAMIRSTPVAKIKEETPKTNFLAMFTRPDQVTFLASISHELKTPLTSIIGFTKLLLTGNIGELNEEQKSQLNIVLNNADHLNRLINDFVILTKIEANKLELSKERYDLIKELEKIKETFSIAAAKKGLEISMKTPTPFIIINDKHRINEILINLIGNAIKFTDKGRITLKVKLLNEKLIISVKDTGLGIKAEDLPRLFKPFSQIIEPGKTKEGSGLGLYLSKRLANLLGGDILIKSKFGKGSTFKLILKIENTY